MLHSLRPKRGDNCTDIGASCTYGSKAGRYGHGLGFVRNRRIAIPKSRPLSTKVAGEVGKRLNVLHTSVITDRSNQDAENTNPKNHLCEWQAFLSHHTSDGNGT